MRYIQVSISATEDEQEILIAALTELIILGFEQTPEKLITYFDKINFDEEKVKNCLRNHCYNISIIPEQNWNQQWEQNFHHVVVEDFCAIRADFHPPIKNVLHELIITPKMSFGTGHHPTTYMMIRQMKEIDFVNRTVLDFGTGTGILSILAEKSGAASVTAVDNDKWSIENATENVAKNKCSKIQLFQSDTIPHEKYQIVLVNINKNVILQNLNRLAGAIVGNGKLIISGFLQNDEKDIRSEIENILYV